MPMKLSMAVSAVASTLAVTEAFVAPSTGLRGPTSKDATTIEAVPSQAADQQPTSSWGLNHVTTLAGCVAAAAGIMRASSRQTRRSSSRNDTLVTRAAETNEYMPGYKMSPAVPYLVYPEMLEGWIGGEKGFDPIRVSDIVDVYALREMELKHGRICMLAVVGWVTTDIGIRFPGEIFQQVEGPLQAHDAMLEAGIMQQLLAIVAGCELVGNFLATEGRKAGREAGDFFIGKNFLPADEEGVKTMKLKELENGRLAMIAFSGIVTQAALYPDKHFPFF